MKSLIALAVAASAILVAGCAGSKEDQIVGNWHGDLKLTGPAASSPGAQQYMDAFKAAKLEMKKDHTYTISNLALGTNKVPDQNGTWAYKDGTVTMTDASKANANATGGAKSQQFKVSDDSKTMTVVVPAKAQAMGSLSFVKAS